MEPSPLVQQSRPDTFQPKIVQLYLQALSTEDEAVLSEGFWREFFLLPASSSDLRKILDSSTADDLLNHQDQTQSLFKRAVREAQSRITPRNENAFETLTAFLGGVLSKKFTNASSDIILVLAGLDEVDIYISDLVTAIDTIIRGGGSLELRRKAIEAALSLTAGAYQTSLVSYLINRDLFPALMKYSYDAGEHAFDAFLLLGLLASYNRFEIQNPYQNRLDDFVNEDTMQQLVRTIGNTCISARDRYIDVQDDIPEGWNLNSTLAFIGFRGLAPEAKTKKVPPTADEAKELFNALPAPEASISLSTYAFVNANKLFASTLATMPRPPNSSEAPFSSLLSLTSYLTHHAHRSQRCGHYALLNLLSLRIITEDAVLIKRLCSPDIKLNVRLCRQRPPHLPLVNSERVIATAILDICTDTLRHNLRRRLDIHLYSLALGIILCVVSHLGRNKTRLQHHWSYLWGALLSVLRFLTQYASDLSYVPQLKEQVCSTLTKILAYCLSAGDGFLSDPASYDDLFYKLIETGPVLTKFRDAYYPKSSTNTNNNNNPTNPNPNITDANTKGRRSVDVLISVSAHYHDLLQAQHGKKTHQSPAAVQAVIRQGYETLSIESNDDFAQWDRWRESSWKAELKRIARTVVEDAKVLAAS